MRFLSVCSGIEAASVAWEPLGFKAVGFSEIEPFPCAVLNHHYPDIRNFGDLTKWKKWEIDYDGIDLICGGTPCQSFSVAGLRKGLDDERGNLCLEFVRLVNAARPRWVVWENVPGVLSSNTGRDFGAFLGGLAESGYGFAYRILDAQYIRVDGFGRAVPQRRRRVFVVGYLGDWRRACAVLLERDCLRGHPAPRREAGKGFTTDACPSLTASGRGVERTGETRGQDPVIAVAPTMVSNGDAHTGFKDERRLVSAPLSKAPYIDRGASDETKLVPHRMVAFGEYEDDRTASAMKARDYKDAAVNDMATSHNVTDGSGNHAGKGNGLGIAGPNDPMFTLTGGDKHAVAGFLPRNGEKSSSLGYQIEEAPTLRSGCDSYGLLQNMSVRRLTPVECERLMGFPDNYTCIAWRGKASEDCPDGPRYKALGNSWAVNCARWVGMRISIVEGLI